MKKQQVFYIHGGSAYKKYHDYIYDLKNEPLRNLPTEEPLQKWPATLRDELGGAFEVFKPVMPNSANAKYEEWKIWFERHQEYLTDDIILLGWSLGAAFYVRYLTENDLKINVKALILLSSHFDYFVSENSREDGGDFYPDQNNLYLLSDRIEDIYILHSKDDFVVPYEHALKYQAALPTAKLVTFEDKNHFLVEELPELIDLIKGFLRESR